MSSIALKTKSTLIQYCAVETCRVGGMENEFTFPGEFPFTRVFTSGK